MLGEILAVYFSFLASLYDMRSGEIPEYITVPLILLGLAMNEEILIPLATFLLLYPFFHFGLLGGGDVLLLTGIAASVPYIGPLPSPLPVLALASALSLIVNTTRYSLLLWKEKKRVFDLLPLLSLPLLPFLPFGPLLVLLLHSLYYAVRREEIVGMHVVEVEVDEIEDEEIVAEDVGLGRRVVFRRDIPELRRRGVRRLKVLRNLPIFGPYIALSLVLSFLISHSLHLYLPLLPK